jgi:hypothetical protein
MITIKCTYANGDTITTDINGTIEDARNYFLGQMVNIGNVEDNVQECVDVKQVTIRSNDKPEYSGFRTEIEEGSPACVVRRYSYKPDGSAFSSGQVEYLLYTGKCFGTKGREQCRYSDGIRCPNNQE